MFIEEQGNKNISFEYIRGLAEGEGSFSFSPNKKHGTKIPSFTISMHSRDKKLLEKVRNKLKLKNKIYEYYYPGKDGYNRGSKAILVVREIGNLKNIIVPLFYNKLIGNKADQFTWWIWKIGNDPEVPNSYKFIYKIYKAGFYDTVHQFD